MAAAPKIVLDLVERFDYNLQDYKQGKYNETQVRREFIDPFFEALGWDVNNTQGYAEAYKDVVHEDAIKVGRATKAPDYSFRIGGVRKFFLEAKKPAVNIKEDIHPAYQLRRYAWSAKLPLSVLTDFEEFAVYDCRVQPVKTDRAAQARTMYLTFRDYAERWEELQGIFSREAILKGAFDKYVDSTKSKRGTAEVDAAFLHEIERWRELLARNLALRNPALSQRELNYAVQLTIDRIIFLRITEDRGIEPYGSLMALQNGSQVYQRLLQLFRQADDRYNSGLFHFKTEKGRGDQVDELTPKLDIDDKVLKDIFKNLYYPDSPYEFSVLGADILGQVYEQFLGKVIRLTAGHRAVVEDKPEVKKAGGVYYTPTYIVDYIVKQTVGQLVADKKPNSRAVRNLRVVDPACGSGSFLLGAYQFLLDWYQAQYVADDPTQHAKGRPPRLYQTRNGEWQLTTDERKRILLTHIYGVDIDPQAVEVTKLSLLLKVLEGEDEQTMARQLSFLQERVLPDMGQNIKCGNSLIGPDFYEGRQMNFLDEAEMYRINVFDWQAEFPQIMADGGFAAVIGNPPYIRIQAMKEWAPVEVEFYKKQYIAASKGNYDIYVVFVEKGLSLLNEKGQLGFILPHKFFNAKYGESLRGLIAAGKHLSDIVHFGDQQIFENATTYTCLLFLDKQASDLFHFVQASDLLSWQQDEPQVEGEVSADKVTSDVWNFIVGPSAELFDRLDEMPTRLGSVAHLFVGLQTNADDVYILEQVGEAKDNVILCKSKSTGQVHRFENDHLKRFVKGSLNIRRYYLSDLTKRLIFPYETIGGTSFLISPDDYAKKFPLTWTYLQEHKAKLAARDKGRMNGAEWYGYVYRKNHTRLDSKKLLVPSIAQGATFAPDLKGEFFFVGSGGGGGGGYGISLLSEDGISYFYLLGLLNSKLSSFYLQAISTPFRGGYIALNRQYIEQLPIRTIDFSNPGEKAQHDELVALVERMLDLHKQLAAAAIPQAKTMLSRQIAATDRAIDQMVYQLYDLTPEEIEIVEAATA